jgi:hypothetical protein
VTPGALLRASAPRPTTRRIRPVSATGVVIVQVNTSASPCGTHRAQSSSKGGRLKARHDLLATSASLSRLVLPRAPSPVAEAIFVLQQAQKLHRVVYLVRGNGLSAPGHCVPGLRHYGERQRVLTAYPVWGLLRAAAALEDVPRSGNPAGCALPICSEPEPLQRGWGTIVRGAGG